MQTVCPKGIQYSHHPAIETLKFKTAPEKLPTQISDKLVLQKSSFGSKENFVPDNHHDICACTAMRESVENLVIMSLPGQ